MILDSSVLVSIALNEPDRDALVDRINAADRVAVAAPTLVETGIVVSARTGRDAGDVVSSLTAASAATVIEFGGAHWREAVSAWWRFGRSRHPARLTFGDCLAYAAARVANEPLLAKGVDFSQTDIPLA